MTSTVAVDEVEVERRGSLHTEANWSTTVFVAGLGLLIADALWNGRGLWFYSDEWNIIAAHHAGNWMQGFNGQWLLIPVAVFWVLLQIFGLFDYLPFRLVGLACYAGLIIVFHHWARERVRPAAAVLAALAVAWYSTAWNVVMMPLLMNFTIPPAMLFVAWLLLGRDRRRADIGVAACLVVAVLSSNVGLVVCFIVAVEFVVSRTHWRRWWVFLPAAVVWVPWFLIWYEPISERAAVTHAAHWGIGLTENYARGFAAGWGVGQWLWLGALAAIFVWASIRRHWNARSVAVLAGIALFVAGASFRAADFHIPVPPDPNWYLWLYSLLVATLLVELVRGVRIHLLLLTVLAVPVAAGAVQLHHSLNRFHRGGIAAKANIRTWFAAADALGPKVADDATLTVNILKVPVKDYASLRQDMGSLAPNARLGDLGDEATRKTVDAWMLENLDVDLVPGPAPIAGCRSVVGVTGPGARLAKGATVQVTAHSETLALRLRRFAGGFSSEPFATVEPHQVVHFSIPTDNSDLPWYLQVEGSAGISACSP